MRVYRTKAGVEIYVELLKRYEGMGMSEVEIGEVFGISRQYLYEVRKKLGYFRRVRSSKGVCRVDPEGRRLRRNKYMREWRKKHRYVKI